jgi:hypothetical protein
MGFDRLTASGSHASHLGTPPSGPILNQTLEGTSISRIVARPGPTVAGRGGAAPRAPTTSLAPVNAGDDETSVPLPGALSIVGFPLHHSAICSSNSGGISVGLFCMTSSPPACWPLLGHSARPRHAMVFQEFRSPQSFMRYGGHGGLLYSVALLID